MNKKNHNTPVKLLKNSEYKDRFLCTESNRDYNRKKQGTKNNYDKL